jgi:long-chain acyl-CoA synthetase
MQAMTDHRPWFRSYPPDVPHTLEPYPDISVFGMLEASARKYPQTTAIAWFGRKLSYGDLLAETERCSAALAALGVTKGDRVALIMPNCPQYVIAYYAIVRLGAIVVGNNPLYTKREMEHQLKDSGSKVVIVLDLLYSDFAEVIHGDGLEHVIVARLNDSRPFP